MLKFNPRQAILSFKKKRKSNTEKYHRWKWEIRDNPVLVSQIIGTNLDARNAFKAEYFCQEDHSCPWNWSIYHSLEAWMKKFVGYSAVLMLSTDNDQDLFK